MTPQDGNTQPEATMFKFLTKLFKKYADKKALKKEAHKAVEVAAKKLEGQPERKPRS